MSVIRTLDILLRARTAELAKDLTKGKSLISAFGNTLRGTLAAAVPTISFAAIATGVSKAIGDLAQLEERSFRLQINPTELSALERVASNAGVSVGGLSTAIRFLTINSGKAADAASPLGKLFSKLKIDQKQFSLASPLNQLQLLSKAFVNIPDRIQRATTAQAIFGKQGLAILPLLTVSAGELKTAFEDLERLNGIFETAEIQKVGILDDKISDLGLSFSNLFNRLAIDLTPSLIDLTDALTEALAPGAALNQTFQTFSGILQLVTKDLGALVKLYNGSLTSLSRTNQGKLFSFLLGGGLSPIGIAGYVSKAKGYLGGLLDSWLGISDAVEEVEKKQKGSGQGASILQTQSIKLNQGSAGVGSDAALETIYGIKIEAPINRLIELQQEQNDILGDMNDKMGQGAGLDADGDVLEDLN
jgi:hypothetical protein